MKDYVLVNLDNLKLIKAWLERGDSLNVMFALDEIINKSPKTQQDESISAELDKQVQFFVG